jgi:hypothetical protein
VELVVGAAPDHDVVAEDQIVDRLGDLRQDLADHALAEEYAQDRGELPVSGKQLGIARALALAGPRSHRFSSI